MVSFNNVPGPNEPPPPYSASNENSTSAPASSVSPAPVSHTSSFDSQGPPLPQSERPSAAQYFASRQPSRDVRIHVHTLSVLPNSVRADFPYPQEWATSRDVSPQDWETFIGFLIPDAAVTRDAKRLSEERKREIDDTLRQWNDNFFLPRGASVRVEDAFSSSAPEAGPSLNGYHALPTASAGPSSSNGGPNGDGSFGNGRHGPSWTTPPPQPQHQQSFIPNNLPPRQEHQHMSTTDRWAKKLRKVAAETTVSNRGIHYHDQFALDTNKLKIGKLVLDANGMRVGDRHYAMPGGGIGSQHHRPGQQHGYFGGGPPAAYAPAGSFQQPHSAGGHHYSSPPPGQGYGSTPPPQCNRWGVGQGPPPQQQGYGPGMSYGAPSEEQHTPMYGHHGPPQTGVVAAGPPAGEKGSRGPGF